MIKYALLTQHFDVAAMQREVLQLEEALWKPHYNTRQYEGSWTTLPLRSINGSIENSVSIQGSALLNNIAYRDTELLKNCAYIKSVIDFFNCEKMSVRLMNLCPGAVIKEHADHEMSLEEGEARFHIPVTTNEKVEFFIEDEKIPMKAGECWYLNLSLMHHVTNAGATNRIHLVIDCKVNTWITNILYQGAQTMKEIQKKDVKVYSAFDTIKIIQQLRLMNTPTSNEIADKMEQGNK